MADTKKPLPQDMVDQDKKKGYESDPFVKLRKKIFGETKATEDGEYKKGGKIVSKVAYKSGGKVRGCGIDQKGLTKGRMV